jgi:cation diffusion facilitator family transporter
MFGLEVTVGLLSGSIALLADSLDMLGDALVYGFSLYVVGRSHRWRAGAALLNGVIMAGFGAMVLVQVGVSALFPEVPDFRWMAITGAVALAANGTCLLLLTRHRTDDLNMRSTWLCSRNDIIANAGVLVAAAGVFISGSRWPDLLVGLVITAIFMRSAIQVVRQAAAALRRADHAGTPKASAQPVLLRLGRCPAGTCPASACLCGAAIP